MSGSKRNSTYSKTIPAESASIASVTPMKVTKEPAGPQPGTPEFVQAQMAERGITANPLQLMSEVGQKRPLGSDAGNAVTLIVVTVFDNSGENNHLPVAIFFKGDVFCVKDNIKQCDTAETIVNGLTIPVVMNALKAKYISGRLMKSLHAMAPPKCAYFAKYIREQCDQCWMVFAIPPEDNIEMLHMAAMVDTRVDLNEYARAWKRALLGKPLHFDSVNIVNYFVSDEEVKYMATMHAAKDGSYARNN